MLIHEYNGLSKTDTASLSQADTVKSKENSFPRVLEMTQSKSSSEFDCTSLEQSFNTWKNALSPQIQSPEMIQRVNANADGYLALLWRADEKHGFDQPQAFLNSLSPAELAYLQAIHGLADPIAPQTLSNEAALNLLMPPNELKDTNKDGFLSVGAGLFWTFPPVDAPDKVKQAWTEATSGMDAGQILQAQASFMPIIAPGTSTADTHAYLGSNTDYAKLVETVRDCAIYAKRFDQPWQHESRNTEIAFLERFQQRLFKLSNP